MKLILGTSRIFALAFAALSFAGCLSDSGFTAASSTITGSSPQSFSLSSPSANSDVLGSVTLNGKCLTGATINVSGSGISAPTSIVCSGGTFAATVALTAGAGAKPIVLKQTDANQKVTTVNLSFNQNYLLAEPAAVALQAAPALKLLSPSINAPSLASAVLIGDCVPGTVVALGGAGLSSSQSVSCNGGEFLQSIALSANDATKAITVSQNTTATATTLVRDSTLPVVMIKYPSNGSASPTAINVTGSCTPGLLLTLSGPGALAPVTQTCAGNSYFALTVPFSAGLGDKPISVSQTSATGQTTTQWMNYIRSASVSPLTIVSPANGVTYATTSQIALGMCDSSANNTVTLSGTALSANVTANCNTANNYYYPITLSSGLGAKTLTVTQTNSSGQVVSVLSSFTVAALPILASPLPRPSVSLSAAQVAAAQALITTTAFSEIYTSLQSTADWVTRTTPPASSAEPAGSDIRGLANNLEPLVTMWVLTRQAQYLTAIEAWAAADMGYTVAAADQTDLDGAHLLYNLSLVYDWCYADLPSALRNQIQQYLLTLGTTVYNSKVTANMHPQYLQNHLWYTNMGLFAAALALRADAQATVEPWAELAVAQMNQVANLLGSDGASQEGTNYWHYGMAAMINFNDLARSAGWAHNDFMQTTWFQKTAAYRIYMSAPQNSWNGMNNSDVDEGDCLRAGGREDIITRRLATEFSDTFAQSYSDSVALAYTQNSSTYWQQTGIGRLLFNYNPGLASTPVSAMPTLKLFDDLGLISTRTDWSGNESLFVMRSGPALGYQTQINGFQDATSMSHIHPDLGSFSLFGLGRYLIRNAGYQNSKMTSYNNTLRIDGQGQLGEGSTVLWTNQGPRYMQSGLTVIQSDANIDYFIADATAAYPMQMGLTSFKRNVVFLKSMSAVIIIDDIAAASAHNFTLDFHPEIAPTVASDQHGWISQDGQAELRLQAFDSQSTVQVSTLTLTTHNSVSDPIPTWKIEKAGVSQWQNAVSMTWFAAGTAPMIVNGYFSAPIAAWIFDLGSNHTLVVDVLNKTASLIN